MRPDRDKTALALASAQSAVAEHGLILLATTGSALFGTAVDTPDIDQKGVCIPPPQVELSARYSQPFEQYEYRTAEEGQRSGPGDVDRQVMGLRKFAWLASQGNPDAMIQLFIPESHQLYITPAGRTLLANTHLFVSRRAGDRFLGYLARHRKMMLGEIAGTNRPELIEQYGYDCKAAYHALRSGYQGIQLMVDGQLVLPLAKDFAEYLIAVRKGGFTKEQILDTLDSYTHQLEAATRHATLPDAPDDAAIDQFLAAVIQDFWAVKRAGYDPEYFEL